VCVYTHTHTHTHTHAHTRTHTHTHAHTHTHTHTHTFIYIGPGDPTLAASTIKFLRTIMSEMSSGKKPLKPVFGICLCC